MSNLENLGDEVIFKIIPKSEQERIRKFNEQYSQFKRIHEEYLRKIKAYREA